MEMTTSEWRDGLCPVPQIRDATEGVPPRLGAAAFTLIELLVVIVIVAILMGLAFPVFQGVQNQAKKTQAKNDLMQIVTAVNAFYTEYGKYPVADPDQGIEKTFSTSTKQLMDILQSLPGGDALPTDATTNKYNPRKIVFLQPPSVKDDTVGNRRSGISSAEGSFYDPWGKAYSISIDWDYDNQVTNPYTVDTGAGAAQIRTGVIAWSLGKNQTGGTGSKTSPDSNDDVISWQ